MKVDYYKTQMRIFLSDGTHGDMRDSLFMVSPMFDTATDMDVTVPDNSYEWLNSFVRLELLDGSVDFLSSVNRFGGDFRPVKIQTTQKAHEMAFHDSYAKQLTNAITAKLAG